MKKVITIFTLLLAGFVSAYGTTNSSNESDKNPIELDKKKTHGSTPVTIESTQVFNTSNDYLKWGSNPVQGTPWSYYDHSVWDNILALYFGGYSGEEYWCTEATTNTPTLMECYEIVVRPN